MQIAEMEICSCHNKVSSRKRVRHTRGQDRALVILNSLNDFNKMSDEPHLNEFIYAEIDSDISFRLRSTDQQDTSAPQITNH